MAPSTGETYLNLFHYHSRLMFVESTCNEDFGKLLSIKLGGIGNLYSIESGNASKRTFFLIMLLICLLSKLIYSQTGRTGRGHVR